MSYENIRQTGNDHSAWIKGLDFYKDDLQLLVHRLEEVARTNRDFDARAGMEHFQNQFIIQRNNIEELAHKIKEHVHSVSVHPALETDQVDSALLADHRNLSDEYSTLEKVINELRKEFNEYLVKFRS